MVDSKIRKQIIDLLSEHFNATDLQGLYIALGLGYDSLSSGGVDHRATALVEYLFRRGRLPELLQECQQWRPNLPWLDLGDVVSQSQRLYHIPHPQNPNFTGRADILQQVAEMLNAGQTTVVTQTIAGLGGVGKTQLALAYCYAYLDAYDLIYWLSADSEPSLGESMVALARRLKLIAPNATDQQAAGQTVRRWLSQTRQRWLLVYDNADLIEPKQLTPYLPRTGNGHILITSRNPNYGGVGRVLELGLFTLDEAVEFLFQRKGATIGWTNAQRGSKEWADAVALAKELGRFPLALEHAAAYVEARGSSYTAYQKLFTMHQTGLWGRAEPPNSYHATITATWEMAFDEIKKTPGALSLLNLCCFLDPEGISLDLIKQVPLQNTHLHEVVADELALDDAIGALRRYSLIQRVNNKLKMHQLVQTVARDRMGEATIKKCIETVEELLHKIYHFDTHNLSTWSEASYLLPHLRSVTELAKRNDTETRTTAYLNSAIGNYLRHNDYVLAAKPYYEQAISILKKAVGDDHPVIAKSYNNIGHLFLIIGDLSPAKFYLNKALRILEDSFGENHIETAPILNDLSLFWHAKGDTKKAIYFQERALKIRGTSLGYDHLDTAESLNSLGGLLDRLGDSVAAKQHLERALAIREKHLDPDHPYIANSLNNLGFLLRKLHDFNGARLCLEKALSICVNMFGTNHRYTGFCLNNLGGLSQEIGDFSIAKSYYKRALSVFEEVLGSDNPSTALSLNSLGGLMQAMGEFTAAQIYYKRALAIREKKLGPDHPDTAQSLNDFGSLLQVKGDLVAARLYFERALTINEKKLDPDHVDTARILNNLGYLLINVGELTKAKQNLDKALTIYEKVLDPDHPNIATSLNNLGLLLQRSGDLVAAKSYYERALIICEKTLGANHPDTAISLNNIGTLLLAMGDLAPAKSYLERALDIRKNTLGLSHPDTAQSLNNIGGLIENMDELVAARPYYKRALVIFEKALGKDHPNTKIVRGNLAALNEELRA